MLFGVKDLSYSVDIMCSPYSRGAVNWSVFCLKMRKVLWMVHNKVVSNFEFKGVRQIIFFCFLGHPISISKYNF